MSRLFRQFVAVLMMLWLPLSSGSALASSLAMEVASHHKMTMAHESCHEMAGMDVMVYAAAHDATGSILAASDDDSGTSCNTCGICHLACSGYLAMPSILAPDMPQAAVEVTPYRFSFLSITPTPLVPPPLVTA